MAAKRIGLTRVTGVTTGEDQLLEQNHDETLRAALIAAMGQTRGLYMRDEVERLGTSEPDVISKKMYDIEQQFIWPALQTLPRRPARYFLGESFDGSNEPVLIAGTLLETALKRGPDAAVAWFNKVRTTTTADMRLIVEVFGVSISKTHKLTNGVALAPMRELGHSRQARLAVTAFSGWRSIQHMQSWTPPIAAYVDIPGATATIADPGEGTTKKEQALQRVVDAVRGLAASGHLAPIAKSHWLSFIDADLDLGRSGFQWGGPIHDFDLRSITPIHIDAKDLSWVERYLTLSHSRRAALGVALDRITAANRRFSLTDRIIDLAIALEAMLGDREQKTEMTHKIRTRAALLLAQPGERRDVRKQISQLYELRSKLVHGHELGSVKAQGDARTVARQAMAHCIAALQKLIEAEGNIDLVALDLGLDAS